MGQEMFHWLLRLRLAAIKEDFVSLEPNVVRPQNIH